MQPTPTELAFIAATLSNGHSHESLSEAWTWTTTEERLKQAYILLMQSALFLQKIERDQAQRTELESKLIPLDTRLEQLMPNIKDKAFRHKKLYNYIEANTRKAAVMSPRLSNTSPIPDEEIAKSARYQLDEWKKKGVSPQAFNEFPEWNKENLHRERVKHGSKGGKTTQAKREASKEAKKRKRTKPEIISIDNEETLDALANPSGKTSIPNGSA